MCGIFGFAGDLASSVSRRELSSKSRQMRRRGPDSASYLIENGFSGGMRRLEINGGKEGIQPITSGGRSVFFNGEIYNYREILPSALSDGEVLPGLLGISEFPEKAGADGMFAIASVDKGGLLLSRDFCGIKPLYYWVSEDGRSLAYSSEISFLFSFDFIGRSEDSSATEEFMRRGFLTGRRTGFFGIRKVLPGEALKFSKGRLKREVMRSLPRPGGMPSLLSLLEKSAKEQATADVPVGLFLSGGFDSSALLLLSGRSEGMKTFSVGFLEENLEAKRVAEYAGAENECVVLEPEEMFSDGQFREIARLTEELSCDMAFLPVKALSKRARLAGLKAAISGEGADELFRGYAKYEAISAIARLGPAGKLPLHKIIPAGLSKFLLPGYGHEGLQRIGEISRARTPEEMNEAYERVFPGKKGPAEESRGAKSQKGRSDLISRILLDDLKNSLPNKLLLKTDKAGMSESVEIRVPFLSGRLVGRFLSELRKGRVPARNKGDLRKALAGRLPPETIAKPKKPFFPPFARGEFLSALIDAVDLSLLGMSKKEAFSSPIGSARKAYLLRQYSAWKEEFKLDY